MHLPPEPGLWPLAPGWWLVAAVLLTLAILAALWLYRRRQRHAYRRAALRELDTLNGGHCSLPDLLTLIRRTARTTDHHSKLAVMPGPELLKEIDSFSGGKLSATDDDSLSSLATALYNPKAPDLTAEQYRACIDATRLWIRKHKEEGQC